MKIKQSKVPNLIRRIAAQHLESLRGTDLGNNTEDLYLSEEVCPIYRPDITEPAYYEFEVLKETRNNPDGRADLVSDVASASLLGETGSARIYTMPTFPVEMIDADISELLQRPVQGFITVSSTEDDFPVPHWSLDHLPLSFNLEKMAKKENKRIKKIYKVDALAYVAEDESGNEIASIGQKPSLLRKLPDNLYEFSGRINSVAPKEIPRSREPDAAVMKKREFLKKGPQNPNIEMNVFTSWSSMKREYAKAFKPMLNTLKSRAKKTWDIEQSIREFGEGIKVGEPHYVPLLDKRFALKVTGEGSELVRVRIVKRPGGNAAAELFCSDESITRETEFKLHIKYGDGGEEHLFFFIYQHDISTNASSVLEED